MKKCQLRDLKDCDLHHRVQHRPCRMELFFASASVCVRVRVLACVRVRAWARVCMF